jgi:hypothetical protein
MGLYVIIRNTVWKPPQEFDLGDRLTSNITLHIISSVECAVVSIFGDGYELLQRDVPVCVECLSIDQRELTLIKKRRSHMWICDCLLWILIGSLLGCHGNVWSLTSHAEYPGDVLSVSVATVLATLCTIYLATLLLTRLY